MSRKESISAEPPDHPLDEVFRRLVGIHASLAESLSTDPKVVAWAERELDNVLRYIQTVRKDSSRAPLRGL
jgi:hypothetical protein